MPRLRDRASLVAVVVPGARPLDELAEALAAGRAWTTRRTSLMLCSIRRRLAAFDRVVAARRDASWCSCIDQFEELWTLGDAGGRDRLLAALVADAAASR